MARWSWVKPSTVVVAVVRLAVRMSAATNLVTSNAAMAMALLRTGENAAAVKLRRALSRAVVTTIAPSKKTWGAK